MIVAALRATHGSEAERVAALAQQFGIHERQVGIALDYAAAHREEIEAHIQANERALVEAERVVVAVSVLQSVLHRCRPLIRESQSPVIQSWIRRSRGLSR